MAETLGSLCDKLTIVNLKIWHSDDGAKLSSLLKQSAAIQEELNEYVEDALKGNISQDKLTFASNKIYSGKDIEIDEIEGSIGAIFSKLAEVNCELWHQQEKVFEFEKVPVEQKDRVVKGLALLNLKRTRCIDLIDRRFADKVREKRVQFS
ncbi:MAG: hypothetical protein JW749_12795 [Sedimentisphaerales bacterium]|nr:hypothetical protein [Sedimentisphaerales bacterium]